MGRRATRWVIRTNRGDAFTATSSASAPGRCTCRNCPAFPASRISRATRFTPAGGTTATPAADPTGAPLDQARRQERGDHRHRRHRRAGRAASRAALRELYVVQRTPSSVDVRANTPIDPEWFTGIATPGWQQRWLENFSANQIAPRLPRTSSRTAGPTCSAASTSSRKLEPGQRTVAEHEGRIRRLRLREDGGGARPGRGHRRGQRDRRAAKPWYRQLCKRPCFHDEYLQSFNEPAAS